MRKMLTLLLTLCMGFAMFTGCDKQEYVDGTYRAEFAEYDSHGFKDYIVVTVEGGRVTQLEFDGVAEDGTLKSEDEAFAEKMQATTNTTPAEVNGNLVNQYLAKQDADDIDAVAGASYSTNSFTALFKALEGNIYKGDTSTLVVDNVAMK